MNPARLVGGWLLLCCLSAGGAYFAMDEIDRRYDLTKYDLRAKVGLSSIVASQPSLPQPMPSGSTGTGSPPTIAPPPAPSVSPVVGTNGPVQPVQPIGGSAPPGLRRASPVGQLHGPTGDTNPGTGGVDPGFRPIRAQVPLSGQVPINAQQPTGGTSPISGQTPSKPNPPANPPTSLPESPPSSNAPPSSTPPVAQVTRPDPKSTGEWRELRSTYEQMSPRATAILNSLEQTKRQTERNHGVFRTDLETEMLGLRESMAAAKRALDVGEIEDARSYLATAYQQLGQLEKDRR